MITNITITREGSDWSLLWNKNNPITSVSFGSAGIGKYVLGNFEGLDRPKVDVKTSDMASTDGVAYNSSKNRERNITFDIMFPNATAHVLNSSIINMAYELLEVGKVIVFSVDYDYATLSGLKSKHVWINCYLETLEFHHFSNDGVMLNVSLIAPHPTFTESSYFSELTIDGITSGGNCAAQHVFRVTNNPPSIYDAPPGKDIYPEIIPRMLALNVMNDVFVTIEKTPYGSNVTEKIFGLYLNMPSGITSCSISGAPNLPTLEMLTDRQIPYGTVMSDCSIDRNDAPIERSRVDWTFNILNERPKLGPISFDYGDVIRVTYACLVGYQYGVLTSRINFFAGGLMAIP